MEHVGAGDVFVVDDGSTYGEFHTLRDIGVNVLRHERNRGKGEALKTAFSEILKGDYTHVLTLDADGQHPPRLIPEFLNLSDEYDVVIGSRLRYLKEMPFHRRLSNRITSAFISVMVGKRVEDSQSGYRLIRREVLERVELRRGRYDMESELLVKAMWMGFSVGFVPVGVIPSKKSFINPVKDVLNAITLATELLLSRA